MAYKLALVAVAALFSGWLGWRGIKDLRAFRNFLRSRPLDLTHLLLTPPPDVQRVIDQLKSVGFARLGEDRSTRADFKRQITTSILVDGEGTAIAEVCQVPPRGTVICGFTTHFGGSAVLVTGHGFGAEHRTSLLVMQSVATSPEGAWQRHQDAREEMIEVAEAVDIIEQSKRR